jgi:hypothetical protein
LNIATNLYLSGGVMAARTNYLWIGELVGQLLAILINTVSVLFLLPYFWGFDAALPAFGSLVYFFFGFITLINLIALGWRWRRTQQRLDTISAQPARWLARWHYDQWTWQEYAQRERNQSYWTLAKWSIPFLGIAGFVAYVWLQFFGQPILAPLLTVMGVNLLVLLVQIGVLPYHRILNTAPEAIITAEGVCIGGSAYFWQQGNTRLRSLTLVEGQPSTLEFKLRVQNGRNRSSPIVRVPVPAGYESQAQQVVARLTLQHR